jgi:hypothetical protein
MYYVLVAGDGETSRANIEALMEDYYYAKGDGGALVLAFKDGPSRSQIYAAQYAVDCKKDIIIFCLEDSKTAGIPGATTNFVAFPYEASVEFLQGQDAIAHLLWDAQDSAKDAKILSLCTQNGIPAFNLCEGLLPLAEVPAPQPVEELAPKLPEEPVTPLKAPQNADAFKEDLLKTVQGVQSMLDLLVKKING